MNQEETCAAVRLLFEAGHLKRTPRTGWLRAGVRSPESVAEHSHRTAVIAWVLAVAEGADPDRAAVLGVFHDLPEARTSDLDYVGRRYVTTTPDEDVAADQAAGLPAAMRTALAGLIREHAGQQTLEAQCARDADKLECLVQARTYEQEGFVLAREWADTMFSAVRTATGKALAEAAMTADPADWWRKVTEAAER